MRTADVERDRPAPPTTMDHDAIHPEHSARPSTPMDSAPPRSLAHNLLRLARPKQWAKCGFVLIGPFYAVADGHRPDWTAVAAVTLSFALAASACYVVNDIRDVDSDRAHPRKRKRPIASGAVSIPVASRFAAALALGAAAPLLLVRGEAFTWVVVAVLAYIANVMLYSLSFKRHVILDVISLSLGFVLRVLGGCAAALVVPSTWLLNCTLFLAMFLAFGKRLGERRTMQAAGADASNARAVHSIYTDDLLRMVVVVTAVATLITYAGYVQSRGDTPGEDGRWIHGFNFLWLTMLPATYGVFRCMVLLERGEYDDPTELATGDRAFQFATALFVLITFAVIGYARVHA